MVVKNAVEGVPFLFYIIIPGYFNPSFILYWRAKNTRDYFALAQYSSKPAPTHAKKISTLIFRDGSTVSIVTFFEEWETSPYATLRELSKPLSTVTLTSHAIKTTLSAHFNPARSIHVERKFFPKRARKTTQSFNEYALALRQLATALILIHFLMTPYLISSYKVWITLMCKQKSFPKHAISTRWSQQLI
jgi:hypothetical protein